ncbi:unnamed protein product, partial [marine sediment metagenome]
SSLFPGDGQSTFQEYHQPWEEERPEEWIN